MYKTFENVKTFAYAYTRVNRAEKDKIRRTIFMCYYIIYNTTMLND